MTQSPLAMYIASFWLPPSRSLNSITLLYRELCVYVYVCMCVCSVCVAACESYVCARHQRATLAGRPARYPELPVYSAHRTLPLGRGSRGTR